MPSHLPSRSEIERLRALEDVRMARVRRWWSVAGLGFFVAMAVITVGRYCLGEAPQPAWLLGGGVAGVAGLVRARLP
jgi:hypothetical protein